MGVLGNTHIAASIHSEFDRWWHSLGQWVEPANQRRGGESGVLLLQTKTSSGMPLYCKRQSGHLYRSLLHPFGRPTILREVRAYRALARLGISVPKLVYHAARRVQGQWQAVLVTEALQDYVSLQQLYADAPSDALRHAVLRQLAITLARLHLGGWQHGCCYPKHIFVKISQTPSAAPPVDIALLDLEKSRRRMSIQSASRHDMRQLTRHRSTIPEEDLLYLHLTYLRALNGPIEER